MIDLGHTHEYEVSRGQTLDNMPDEVCKYCKGTGEREWTKEQLAIQVGAVDAVGELLGLVHDKVPEDLPKPVKNKCNVCNGSGKVRPWETKYPFDVNNVKNFMLFAAESGGFQVY